MPTSWWAGTVAPPSCVAPPIKRSSGWIERREVGQAERRVVAGNTAGVQALITDRVRTSDGRISAKRLLPIVRAAGYSGSARDLRRAVADAKTTWKRKQDAFKHDDS